MNRKAGYKPTEVLKEGIKGLETFIDKYTNVFSKCVDINSNTNFTELQNKVEYVIKKNLKTVVKNNIL